MRWVLVCNYKDEFFRRVTGVKRSSFNKMINILNSAEHQKKSLGGKPSRLSMEDRLLMALEYLREYRTYFHIASSYGVSESSCYRNIRWIENTLIKHPDFALPGRKSLIKSDMDYEVILIDATESPIQRPKKDKSAITRVRRKDTH